MNCNRSGHARTRSAGDRGFTLIEIQVALALTAIVAGMTVVTVQHSLTAARGDTAMMQLAGAVRLAREASISQRRTIDLRFTEPNEVRLIRNDVPDGTTDIGVVVFENGAALYRHPEVPDTPDGYGAGSSVDFGDADTLRFQPDGMLTDGAGVPVNGTVFLAVRGDPGSVRAVTLTGSSGRAQSYRWTGTRWEAQ